MKKTKESEGEEIIRLFLEEKGIRFIQEKEISDLEGDYKQYRLADFYLPDYKVFIEFLGRSNLKEGRSEYNFKKEIYDKNNKPCVYIYPDNLGVLEFIFKRRLRETLKKHEMKWELFRFNFKSFLDDRLFILIVLGALVYVVKDLTGRILLSIALAYYIYDGVKENFLR